MKNIKVLEKYEEFRKVFGLFQGYPFFEAWTEKEFQDEFEFLKNEGEVFGCYNQDNEIVGLSNLLFEAQSSHPVRFDDPKKVMYISDIAVLEQFRGNGYAKALADYVINYTEGLNKYELMYLRTNLVGSMSEKIFVDRGFEIMKDNGKIITQDVSFARTRDDIPSLDTRKFLIKTLTKRR